MSLRLLRISTLYRGYLNQYERKYPQSSLWSYSDQYSHLMQDSLDAASALSKYLIDAGIEAKNIYANATTLQSRWGLEHDVTKVGEALIFEQVKEYKPDVLWIDDQSLINEGWISSVRKTVKSLRIITGFVCAPYTNAVQKGIKSLDFLLTCVPSLREEFEAGGVKTYLVYHAFDANILDKIGIVSKRSNSLVFGGSLHTGAGFHKTRIEFLEAIVKSGIPVNIFGNLDSSLKVLKKKAVYTAMKTLELFHAKGLVDYIPLLRDYKSYGATPIKSYSKQLKQNIFPAIYGLDQFRLLSKYAVCFNIHGEIAKACAGNMRLFEATGMGNCLVTDWKQNLSDLFEPGSEIVTYRNKQECIEKLNWLTRYPDDAKRIAKAGQIRTLRDHNMKNRAIIITDIISKQLKFL